MRNLIDILDLSVEEIDELIKVAKSIMKSPLDYSKVCNHKKLATLFFEPSTRTRLSFESAMIELGGSVIGFSSANSSSTAKGESVADTVRTVGCYSDIIAMRHPKDGAALVASEKSPIPIINAGDGGHHHPTQTLTDLLTISAEKERLDNLTIGMCGDLKFGRTVHSLIAAMSRYKNNKFILISPEGLKIPEYIKKDILEKNNIEYIETADIEEYMDKLDIIYMTRVQRERFDSEDEYNKVKDCYVLKNKTLEKSKKDLCIMHPLPRVNEISVEVDEDPRAAYFRQVKYGKYIRMALIMKLLEEKDTIINKTKTNEEIVSDLKCKNPRCITSIEQELPNIYVYTNKVYRCKYCETINELLT
ncbi:MAG: aspartate carbamoyltransferase [Clostridia bacterium]|nr:aspartate carbamoyltransferase [Clostridia bacterium]